MKNRWIYHFWIKAAAFVLAVVLAPVIYLCLNPGLLDPRSEWGAFLAYYSMPILILSSLLLLILIIYLGRSAGRQPESGEIVPGWQEKIPLDLYLGLAFAAEFFPLMFLYNVGYAGSLQISVLDLFLLILLSAARMALALGAWMTICVRSKTGSLWRGTLLSRLFGLLKRFFLWISRGVRGFAGGFRNLVRSLPLIKKTVLLTAILWVYTMICLLMRHDTDVFTLLILAGVFALSLFLILSALQLRRLFAGGADLAAGNLDAKVDTRRMLWDFKRHGENLNAISRGMQHAVDERINSEHLKTELITNVSHDIKTPLTSIVNYVDLLRRDSSQEHTAEYLEVLDRQSRRLKKLTEDLVELSKASTGNVPVNLSRRSLNELLTQAVGEYSDRLESAQIEPVLTLPEQELFANVDGALLWRVLDNIFSNVCKYALPGTRFFIQAETAGSCNVSSAGNVSGSGENSKASPEIRTGRKLRMSFKNVSRDRLDISPEELMERFVRGDSSRSGEGSGLGLNIARSLTELQGGTLTVDIDGDLFRVDIELPE